MAIDDVRIRLRHRLEEMLGVDEAAMLMDRPPGGWSDRATGRDLEALKLEVMAALHQELRAQTWRLVTAVLTAMSVLTAVFGLVVVLATG